MSRSEDNVPMQNTVTNQSKPVGENTKNVAERTSLCNRRITGGKRNVFSASRSKGAKFCRKHAKMQPQDSRSVRSFWCFDSTESVHFAEVSVSVLVQNLVNAFSERSLTVVAQFEQNLHKHKHDSFDVHPSASNNYLQSH